MLAVSNNKRSVMTLYSEGFDVDSHRIRIVLAEKGVAADVIDVVQDNYRQDLMDVNPYQSIPTFVDRDLVLYEPRIIMEYLDERFPHPPLMPVYPIARAKTRLMMLRIDQDWYSLVKTIEASVQKVADKARKELIESITSIAPVFADKPFFLSDELTLLDCSITPILWRLSTLKVELPAPAKPVLSYAKRMFARKTFQMSLTEIEREMNVV